METLSEASTRLGSAGYADTWVADHGRLRCLACGTTFDPSEVVVDEVNRFEGTTDPGDEAILVALTGPRGHRGQYDAAYGPATSPEDAVVLRVLSLPRT